jgi:hypothetical protein
MVAKDPEQGAVKEKHRNDSPEILESETVLQCPSIEPSVEENDSGLSLQTILTVLAVNVIYFAHLVNLVGAGAVSDVHFSI